MEKIAEKMAITIKQRSGHPSSIAVLKYALEGILNTVVTFALLLLIAAFLGKVLTVFTLVLAFGILRLFTGGAHLGTGWGCTIVSTGYFIAASFIPVTQTLSYVYVAICLVILLWKPYYLEPHQSSKALQYKKRYQYLAFFWIALGFSLSYSQFNTTFSFGLFLQSLTVTPLGVRAIHILSRWLERR